MHMLLERAASLFQSQGFTVRVRPCVIGASGAIHNPDLVVARDGEPERAVFVLDALDGPMPLEHRRGAARDMGCEAVFVIGRPSEEVQRWVERHGVGFVSGAELGEVPEAPASTAPRVGDSDADILAVSPRRGAAERPLAAFAPGDGLPAVEHAASGAVLLPGDARRDAPRPRPPRVGRGVVQFPAHVPEDGDAVLLDSAPREPERAALPAQPAGQPGTGGEPVLAEEGGSGAELLPSAPQARVPHEADRVAKHDLSIWNPAARLQQVKQAAKAGGFETTAPQEEPAPFASDWLNRLRK